MSGAASGFGLRRPVAAGAQTGAPEARADLLPHLGGRVAELSLLRLARQGVFLATLLVTWISLKPFPDLSRLDIGDIVTGQEGTTYATFGLLALAGLALVVREHGRALASLATPALTALAGWLALSVVLSQDHATSAKRLALTAAVALLAASLPLLTRSRAELRNLLALAALALLAACYIGMLLVPELSIHQLRDIQEPALAGNWRGTFGHKNAAAAVMAMLLIVGVAVFRAGLRVAGAVIVLLAGTFLVGSEGKSAFALSFVVFAITGCFVFVRSLAGRAILALGPILLFNLFTVGSVTSDALGALVAKLPVDATFTGRTDIWRFAIENVARRPVTGYGFSAFWNTQSVRDIAADASDWAGSAAHSHNGYLDTALTLGTIGLVLLIAAIVLKPLRDYQRLSERSPASDPFATMFLQIWLFGLLLSSMESFFFDRSDPIWVTFLIAVFGLHYLGRFRTR